jgi:hypothetical protein
MGTLVEVDLRKMDGLCEKLNENKRIYGVRVMEENGRSEKLC